MYLDDEDDDWVLRIPMGGVLAGDDAGLLRDFLRHGGGIASADPVDLGALRQLGGNRGWAAQL